MGNYKEFFGLYFCQRFSVEKQEGAGARTFSLVLNIYLKPQRASEGGNMMNFMFWKIYFDSHMENW